MKGIIQADHIPLNQFQLVVLGLGSFTFISITGLEEELNVVDLPDRTVASGGRTNPLEFVVALPLHHKTEQLQMELWFRESQDPVLPTYKKPATLILPSISRQLIQSYALSNVFPSKRGTPDFELDNDGEMAANEWTMRADSMLPLP